MSDQNRQLEQSIDELAREKQPERDLWQGIEIAILKQHTIEPGEQEALQAYSSNMPWRNTLAIAASLCIITLVAFSAFYGGQQTSSLRLVEQLSQQHEQHKARLLISFEDMPTSTDNWRKQLNDLSEAEKAIKHALENSPNNPALLGMLKHVYQQELAIIERVHAPTMRAI
jgi:anti-sigma-K factor RskA